MVIHETIGMAEPIVALINLVQSSEEVVSISVVFVNRLLFISPGGNMIYSARVFDAQRPGHNGTISEHLSKVKHYRPDPSSE